MDVEEEHDKLAEQGLAWIRLSRRQKPIFRNKVDGKLITLSMSKIRVLAGIYVMTRFYNFNPPQRSVGRLLGTTSTSTMAGHTKSLKSLGLVDWDNTGIWLTEFGTLALDGFMVKLAASEPSELLVLPEKLLVCAELMEAEEILLGVGERVEGQMKQDVESMARCLKKMRMEHVDTATGNG